MFASPHFPKRRSTFSHFEIFIEECTQWFDRSEGFRHIAYITEGSFWTDRSENGLRQQFSSFSELEWFKVPHRWDKTNRTSSVTSLLCFTGRRACSMKTYFELGHLLCRHDGPTTRNFRLSAVLISGCSECVTSFTNFAPAINIHVHSAPPYTDFFLSLL